MKKTNPSQASASRLIDARIADLGDWRGKTLSRLRELIKRADAAIVEEWKWGVPVWSHDGIVCTGETYKSHVKLTFAKGAQLKDPKRLFNASLDGNVRRALDVRAGDKIDAAAFTALIREAVALNEVTRTTRAARSRTARASKASAAGARPARGRTPARTSRS
jgi:hypothetical protein